MIQITSGLRARTVRTRNNIVVYRIEDYSVIFLSETGPVGHELTFAELRRSCDHGPGESNAIAFRVLIETFYKRQIEELSLSIHSPLKYGRLGPRLGRSARSGQAVAWLDALAPHR